MESSALVTMTLPLTWDDCDSEVRDRSRRILASFEQIETRDELGLGGIREGRKVDLEGNVCCGGPGRLWVLDSSGNHLGAIVDGAPITTNLAFDGEDWKTLFFTTRNTLGRVRVTIPGVPVSAQAESPTRRARPVYGFKGNELFSQNLRVKERWANRGRSPS